MKRANEIYNAVAEFINDNELTSNQLSHVVALMAAQMPNAHSGLVEMFLFADLTGGEGTSCLTRLSGGVDPGRATPVGFMLDGPSKVSHSETPKEDERPTVLFKKHHEFDTTYIADRHNTALLCKFHEQGVPDIEDFDEKKSDELLVHMSYGHVNGGFVVHFYRPGHSHVVLHGEFTLDSFIPVRVQVTNG